MQKRSIFNFEFKVIVLMFFIFVIVLVTGVLAYYRFSAILASINESVKPDDRLVVSHTLKNDLAELSNIAKSHSLTEDFSYRKNYILLRNDVNLKLNELKKLTKKFGDDLEVDSLQLLIDDKLTVLDGIIYAEDPFRVQTALGKVILNIDNAPEDSKVTTASTITSEPAEKVNIKESQDLTSIKDAGERIAQLSKEEDKLLKKKKRAEKRNKGELISELDSLLTLRQNEAKAVQREVTRIDEMEKFEKDKRLAIKQIYKGIENVSYEELTIEKKIKYAQLQLLKMDNLLSLQIANFFDKFELNEKNNIAIATKKAEKENEETTNYFVVFSIFVALLLLIMAFIIIQYVKKNNLYKSALKRSKYETDQLIKTRERLIATITHEIRTPMHAISGFAAQLSKSKLNQEDAEYVKMIRTSSEHLTYLVNDVLDLSKLQSGKMKLIMEPFHLKNLANEVVLFSKELVQDGRLSVIGSIDENLHNYYIGDAHRLRQILLNLMSNAVKFTDRGAVELSIVGKEMSGDNQHIRIMVEDTGIGMSAENLENIFEEFKQFQARKDNKIIGTGLGLSITKRLIELQHGEIAIKSEQGKGTSVQIDLFLAPTDKLPEVVTRKENLQLASKSILIVDDESYNRKLLTSILKDYKVQLQEAENGKDALSIVENSFVDLILLDARMPVMDGMQTMLALNDLREKGICNAKVILLTAAGTELEELVELVDGYVAKPFSEEVLILEINRIFNGHTEVSNNMELSENLHNTKSIDLTQLKSLSGSDKNFYKDMLQTFLDSTRSSMHVLELSLKNGDLESVANEAHKIASPCRHLGALKMHAILKELESIARDKRDLKSVRKQVKSLNEEIVKVLQDIEEELNAIV